jgi:hypothetical protein
MGDSSRAWIHGSAQAVVVAVLIADSADSYYVTSTKTATKSSLRNPWTRKSESKRKQQKPDTSFEATGNVDVHKVSSRSFILLTHHINKPPAPSLSSDA